MPFAVASNDTSRQLRFNYGGHTERRKLFSIPVEGHHADTKYSSPVMRLSPAVFLQCKPINVKRVVEEVAKVEFSETTPLKRPPTR